MLRASIFVRGALLAGVLAAMCAVTQAGDNRNHKAILSGDGEVPPRDTQARGVAIFHISKDGTSIDYILISANIHNVVGAHIHTGQPGVNGPIVVPLMEAAAPGGGRFQGILGAGTITAANLTGPLAGQPLSALIAEIKSGNTYVNVHTNDGVAPTNTGPGDFPGGEIRGPIR